MDEKFIKLADKAYKLADFFPEEEPIKNKTKEKILEIMGDAENNSSRLYSDIEILLGYLALAKNRKWINNVNFLILSKEFEEFKKEKKTAGTSDIQHSPVSETGGLEKLTERQKKIIEMLKEKEKAQVADIVKILPNVTKRTIRRDLDDLLGMGKVIRIGEWNQVVYMIGQDRTNLNEIGQNIEN